MLGSAAVPFPDARYRTIALSWHRSRTLELATPTAGRRCAWRASSSPAAPPSTSGGRPCRVHHHLGVATVASRRPGPRSNARCSPRPAGGSVVAGDRPPVRAARPALRPHTHPPTLPRGRVPALDLLPLAPGRACACSDRGHSPRCGSTGTANKLTRAEQARQRTLRIGVVGLSAGHADAQGALAGTCRPG